MDDRQIADFLEELAESLSFQIRYEPVRLDEELGNRPGGVCLLKGQRLIIIDPQARNVSSEMRHFHQEFSVAPNRFFERGD
jgi:hypothetical protein